MTDKQLLNQKYGMVISARGAGRLTAEKHEKLVGYVLSNEVLEGMEVYFDECEWVEI